MTRDVDVLIVGAGPAALAAAHALEGSGATVAVVEAGDLAPRAAAPQPFLSDLRRGEDSDWPRLLGRAFGGQGAGVSVSPKMRVHVSPTEIEGWKQSNRLETEGFVATGLLRPGGLSTLWGAMTPLLDTDELTRLGLPAEPMTDAYRAVTRLMGVSGPPDARFPHLMASLPASPNAERLARRHRMQGARPALRLARPHQAVLTEAHGGRKACNACGACLWGCGRNSIFDASIPFAAMAARGRITLYPNSLVQRLVRDGERWGVRCETPSAADSLRATSLVLAAGHLPTTRLVLDHLSLFERKLPLQHAPAFAFAALLPERVGAALPERAFGMAQLAFELPLAGAAPGDEPLYGAIYEAGSVAPSDLFAGTPLGISSFAFTAKALMQALVLVFCYLPASYSNNAVILRRASGGSVLHAEGTMDAGLTRTLRKAAAGVQRELASLGAIALPGSLQLYAPGAEVHAGAELARAGLIQPDGSVAGASGLYVADTSALPAIPAKHPTLTAMANAYRIAAPLASYT